MDGDRKVEKGKARVMDGSYESEILWKLITKVKKTLNSRHDQETALI